MTFTAQKITQTVQQILHYGEYDEMHDRSPSYTLEDRCNFLDKMLQNRDDTEPAGQKVILQFIRTFLQEHKHDPQSITQILSSHTHIPEVKKFL
jgi:hypothetical protein